MPTTTTRAKAPQSNDQKMIDEPSARCHRLVKGVRCAHPRHQHRTTKGGKLAAGPCRSIPRKRELTGPGGACPCVGFLDRAGAARTAKHRPEAPATKAARRK